MNALQLADTLLSKENRLTNDHLCESAAMLRRQHEAIQKLREALDDIRCSSSCGYRQKEIAEQALKDTEGL